jgi:hypothetical protein
LVKSTVYGKNWQVLAVVSDLGNWYDRNLPIMVGEKNDEETSASAYNTHAKHTALYQYGGKAQSL